MQPCANCTCMQSVSVNDVWQAVQRLLPAVTRSEASKEQRL
jgi:hypothetical protein